MPLTIKQKLLLTKMLLGAILMVPLGMLITGFFTDNLGANPVEKMTHVTGDWALRILLISLAVTPMQRLFKWRKIILYRRLLGLLAFFYALLHFSVYLIFDQELNFADTLTDIKKRPYILLGTIALGLMIPLALTSTDRMIRRLGAKKWKKIHKSVYLVCLLAITHYWWLVKADISLPAFYLLIFSSLMVLRLNATRKSHKDAPAKTPPQ